MKERIADLVLVDIEEPQLLALRGRPSLQC